MRRSLPALLLAAILISACQPGTAPARPTPAPQRPSPVTQAGPTAEQAAPTVAASGPTSAPEQPPAVPAGTPAPAPAALFDDQRLNYEPDFYALQIQAYLDSQPGRLKGISFAVGDRRHSFAEALTSQTSYYSVNPKLILALLELHGDLIGDPEPSADQLGWAVGYHGESGNRRGLQAQVRWAVKQILYARRDYPSYAPLTYADNNELPPPAGMTLAEYVLARVLAPTTTSDRLPRLMQLFVDTYTRLFGDPRLPPEWPAPAAPFLSRPTEEIVPVTSFFDHGGPFLTRVAAAGITTYWGRTETDMAFAYNGHDGWDYAAAPPDMALAAADGEVVFAGNADDGCNTRSVVLDHGNGYRTLYWHLQRVDVEIGQRVTSGEPIGMIGNTGCSSGPHLHFGVQYLGRNTDPYGWCGPAADPWRTNPAGSVSTWLWKDRPSPCDAAPPGATLVDTDSPGFVKSGDGWQEAATGHGGAALFVPSMPGADARGAWELRPLDPPAVAVWRATLPAAGRYRVLAYLPYALSGLEDPRHIRYYVRYSGGQSEVEINTQVIANEWADLGTYSFAPGQEAAVVLSNAAEGRRLSIWADAVVWLPATGP